MKKGNKDGSEREALAAAAITQDRVDEIIDSLHVWARSAFDNAYRFGAYRYASLPVISICYVENNSFYRSTKSKSDKITANWNNNQINPIKVWFDPKLSLFYLIDGKATLEAAKNRNEAELPAQIIDCETLEEAIEVFLHQSDIRSRLAPKDTFRALLAAGDENAKALKDVCNKHKIGTPESWFDMNTYPYHVFCIELLMKICKGKDGAKTVDTIFTVIHSLLWDNVMDGLYQSIIYSIHKLVTKNKQLSTDELIERLRKAGRFPSDYIEEARKRSHSGHLSRTVYTIMEGVVFKIENDGGQIDKVG